MSVLVVGSMAYDSVITPEDKRDKALGGSAMFFSSAASFFTPVNLVAVVGEDFDKQELDFLIKRGVNLDGLATEKGETFRWKGRYLDDMNERETIYTHLNVFEHFDPVLPESYRNNRFVFLANINPDLQYNVLDQIEKPDFVAMDTMNFWITGTPDELQKTLEKVDALIINDSEVRLLSKEQNIMIGARKIQEMGPRILIVKRGEYGALLIHGNSFFNCPAFPVEQLFDPTGAGDTFAGGFVGYLARTGVVDNENLRRAVVYATALASFCVEAFSADRLKELTTLEIQNRTEEIYHMTRFELENIWDKA